MEPLEFIDEQKVKPSFCFLHELYVFIITKKATLISLELYCQKECTWV